MWHVFAFECRHQSRSPLFVVVAGVFFLLGFLVAASESVSVGGIGANLDLNAAFAIVQIQLTLSIVGMFAAVAFVAGAITRDVETRTAEIFYASGIGERRYLLGRFLGGWLFATLAVAAGLLGTLVGTLMPWLDPERVGPFRAAPYLFALWVVLIPNLFVICALFFSVAALARSMMAAYLAALGLMIAFVVLNAATDPEQIHAVALADPFGTTAFAEVTRYWTVFERNAQVPPFAGSLLVNRLIWIAVGALALLVTVWRFRFALPAVRQRRRRREPPVLESRGVLVERPILVPATGWRTDLARLGSQLRTDVRGIVRSVPFYVLLAFGMFNVIGGFIGAVSQLFGTPVLPVTGLMVQVVRGAFSFVVLIVIVYYSGELVHRERQYRVADLLDATPYPSAIMVIAKVAALWFVIAALLLVVMLTSMVVQTAYDFYDYQPGVYIESLFGIDGYWMCLLCIPAVLIQVLARSKFLGMFVFLIGFIGLQALPSLGFEHNLYLLSGPDAPYSAMNGYGHFVEPLVAFGTYWFCVCLLLLVAAHLLYPRGSVDGWRARFATARARWVPGLRLATAVLVFAWVGLGGWIFYNTNVLNDYVTEDDQQADRADYEKRYRQFRLLPAPGIVDLDVDIAIFPEQRRIESKGVAIVENDSAAAMDRLHLSVAPALTVNELTLPGARLDEADEPLGYYRYRLEPPLAPGDRRELRWDLTWANPGFENSGSTTRVVYNGTFVDSTEIMPAPGYDSSRELTDNNVRRDHDLPPVQRRPELGDPQWLGVSQFGVHRRSGFRATVSTAADQIALAPGYLEREWQEDGRRHFVYAMDAPIWPFASFSSARYTVARDRWRDVALEVYYHPSHGYNVEAMLHASKRSLDYFSREFSPYQYRQFRILEFPGYQQFAQSFPNTVPYSEAIGFVADLRDEDAIDYVFYVTAHEMAHQWWGHQVAGAFMQGATVIVETMAQYSALMVQEEEFGPDKMRRFLKYELDNYLRSRGGELIEELPLMYVEDQGYIHYRKGSLVMYALKDYIGEAAINRALRGFLERYAFAGPPFPTARDLVDAFRAEAGPQHQALISDLFEKIVLFDLAVDSAVVEPLDDGYQVTMSVTARKFEADGSGRESPVPMDYQLDVGVFPADPEGIGENDLPKPLLLEKRRIVDGAQTLTFKVDERPGRVGIDPYNKMIDRNPDDNLRRL